MKIHLLPAAALLLLLAAGCSTFNRRAQEKAAVFDQLDAAQQARLRRGQIAVGDSKDMVYIALGAPDFRQEQSSAKGKEDIWSYLAYYQEYAGSTLAGFRRDMVYDPKTKQYYVMLVPVSVDVYRNRTEDRIRITFRDGKVAVVEQLK